MGCACCPPNLARLLTSLEQYIYLAEKDQILINLFIASRLHFEDEDGSTEVEMETDYPRSGKICIRVRRSGTGPLQVGIRIPGWAEGCSGTLDGQEVFARSSKQKYDRNTAVIRNSYWYLTLDPGEYVIGLVLEMVPKRWYANPRVSADAGMTAICRGPQVFCVEEVDNGADLHNLYLPEDADLHYTWKADLLGGTGVIECDGLRLTSDQNSLYTDDRSRFRFIPQKIRLIPYYAWANRGENEMRVWLHT